MENPCLPRLKNQLSDALVCPNKRNSESMYVSHYYIIHSGFSLPNTFDLLLQLNRKLHYVC